ncbi:MAG: hypothetical protein WCB86_05715 [Candidatus Dormiibacterota bacterium]
MSKASRPRLKSALGVVPGVALAGILLSACVGPAPAARDALNQWLSDVRIHSVAYAYTLLSQHAEQHTNYDLFFNGVNASEATYKVLSVKVISANDVSALVRVQNRDGAPATTVRVQVVEEGNAGDWLVSAPFSSEGARAIAKFK